ncbi:MAG TPA: hypothetical protein VHX65_04205 [Pirellulales bacterium]|jgi:hypothetical protein|nr:hypothetical protein [Pirellulales bacterium]
MATLDSSSLADLARMQRQLVARLAQVRRRVRLWLWIEGTAIVLAEAVGLGLFSFWADHTLRLGIAVRIGLLAASVLVLAVEAVRRIAIPLLTPLGLVALAGAIGKKSGGGENGDFAGRVASVLELPALLNRPSGPSPAMIDHAIRRRHEALAGTDFRAALDRARLRNMLLLLAMGILVPAALVARFPETAGLWARRLFLASREPWPQNTYLRVADERDGRIQVPRGEPYVLRAGARDGSIAPQRIFLTIHGEQRTNVLMKQFGENDFRHDFAVVDDPLRLELEGGDDDYGPLLLAPVDRPRVVGLELEAQHPRQAIAEKHDFNGGDADLSFLVKTRIWLHIAANVPLRELRLKSQSAHPKPAELRRIDDTHFAVDWVQSGPAKFDLELVAAESGLVSLPVPVSIGLKVDQSPRVTMSYGGVRQRVTPQAKIPLAIDARDDYGLTAVGLTIKDETPDPADSAKLVARSVPQPIFPANANPKVPPNEDPLPLQLPLKQTLDVAAQKLAPGSFLSITAVATDNCYTGPQTSRSRTIVFGIVASEELFREILLRQQAERIKFRKQTEEAETIRGLIEASLSGTSVAKQPPPKQLAEIARRHRALQLETLRIATVLGEALTEIKLNGLGSPESHALMEQKVLLPLKGLGEELLSPQTAAIDAIAPAPGAEFDPARLRPLLSRQETIITRMKEILQQMAQWDSFVDVLNQLDQIIKLETDVKAGSQKLEKKETDSLFDK